MLSRKFSRTTLVAWLLPAVLMVAAGCAATHATSHDGDAQGSNAVCALQNPGDGFTTCPTDPGGSCPTPTGLSCIMTNDLQTGNAEAGRKFFTGTGKCNTCHNEKRDLAGVSTRLVGLKLIERLLYPKGVKPTVAITLRNGETVNGVLAYKDEFNIALVDKLGHYRAWPAETVTAKITDPAQAHADLLAVYSDDDIHNLMAYLQALR